MTRRHLAATFAVAAVTALTACGRSVPVPVTSADAEVTAACTVMMKKLPDHVGGMGKRPTTPPSAVTSAYGDPAIVVQCGVPTPAALTPTSTLIDINGVSWFPEAAGSAAGQDSTSSKTFSTVHLVLSSTPLTIRVTVPPGVEPATFLAQFSLLLMAG